MLVKPNKQKKQVEEEEKQLLKIKNAVKTDRFKKDDDLTPEEQKQKIADLNQDIFVKKYPAIKDEMLEDIEQFNKDRPNKTQKILRNPDMSFCSLILSLMMLSLSMYTFYSQRDFVNEYFNRDLFYQRLNKNPYNYVNFDQIKRVEDFKLFMTETVANQFFETEKANKKPGDPGYDKNFKSKCVYQTGIMPLGKLRLR